jgi:hypothetical protein
MAAVGFTPIQLYYSTTSGASGVPTAGNLTNGELAINITDGKLFYKDNLGAIQVIGTKGGVGSSTNTQVLYNASGLVVGSGSLTFDGTILTAGGLAGPFNGTVGATTANAGAFTTLSASSTVSGTGFSTYLASPPAIGGTAPAAGTFTTVKAIAAATQDAVILQGRSGGSSSFGVTLTPATLTGSRTLTLPDVSGTILQTGTTVTIGQGGTGQTSASAAFNALSPITTTGDLIIGNGTNSATRLAIGATSGYVLTTNGTTASWQPSTGGVTSVGATAPVASSGGSTPTISLNAGYGDTLNPYASKTANFVLAAPNGSAGVPTFRAIVAADIPTLNQNTTGTAGGLSSTLAVSSGGTGQTTYTDGQLLIGNSTGNTLTKATLTAGTNITITNSAGGITIAAAGGGGSGTVTSVGQTFTGGIVSVTGSPITTSGTLALTVAGTSGGVPYFSGATTWASSAVLASNALVVGGGAGNAPATVSNITSNNSYLQLGATTPLRFADSDSSNYVSFQAPATITSNVAWTLPATDGTASQALVTNGSGTLSWASVSSTVANGCIYLNNLTISSNYTIAASQGAMSVGPITVASGATVTVSSGSRYVVF